MIQVGLLTEEQRDLLLPVFAEPTKPDVPGEQIGQLWDQDSFFYPVQDGNANWVISTEEIDGCITEEFQWVKTLPLITWVPPVLPPTI